MLSIIIITLNEEKYLPKLLDSIKRQKFYDYEVIVSDGNSNDATRKIARKYDCKVLVGNRSPSIQRNAGARAANGNLLLFLDADVILPENFLMNLVKEIHGKNLDVGTCYVGVYDGSFSDKFIFAWQNFFTSLLGKVWPHAFGCCIFSKPTVHRKIKGFDKSISWFEDTDYVKRASKEFKFGILNNLKVLTSSRRWKKEGRLRLIAKHAV